MELSLENPNDTNPNVKHSMYFPTPLGVVSLLSVEVINDNNSNDNSTNDNDNNDNKDIDNNDNKDNNDSKDNNDIPNNDNNDNKKKNNTIVRLVICTPFAKVVATLKVVKGTILLLIYYYDNYYCYKYL